MCSTLQRVLLLGTNVPPLHTTRRIECAPPPSNNKPTTTQPTGTALGTGLPTRTTRTTTGASTGITDTPRNEPGNAHDEGILRGLARAPQNGPVPAQPTRNSKAQHQHPHADETTTTQPKCANTRTTTPRSQEPCARNNLGSTAKRTRTRRTPGETHRHDRQRGKGGVGGRCPSRTRSGSGPW